MKILMLCPMISSSSFITTYPYAKILSKKHDVKIVGPLFGKQPYIKDKSLKFEFIEPLIKKPYQLGVLSLYRKNLKRLLKDDYDVVHAFKLLPHTAPAAAKAKRKTGKPFILSIDDYDVAAPKNFLKKLVLKRAEKAYKEADAITVSSTFLQKIYGGEVIYQVANEFVFAKKRSGARIRKMYDLEDKIVIVHAGTFYEHKGIDVLIKAVQALNRKDVKLLLIGNGNVERYKKLAGPETIFTGKIPITEIPEYAAAADIYAIPTKDTLYAKAEISAKIFEAMMQEKAIVASNISDNSLILDRGKCGVLVKPSSVNSLRKGLQYVMDNPEIAKQMGIRAKKRYFANYSYKQIEAKINKLYSRIG